MTTRLPVYTYQPGDVQHGCPVEQLIAKPTSIEVFRTHADEPRSSGLVCCRLHGSLWPYRPETGSEQVIRPACD